MVYLMLFHGRTDPDVDMSEQGTDGPVLGPFTWVHTTYGSHVKPGDGSEAACSFDVDDGMLLYDGVYYGDWSVICGSHVVQTPALADRRAELELSKVNV